MLVSIQFNNFVLFGFVVSPPHHLLRLSFDPLPRAVVSMAPNAVEAHLWIRYFLILSQIPIPIPIWTLLQLVVLVVKANRSIFYLIRHLSPSIQILPPIVESVRIMVMVISTNKADMHQLVEVEILAEIRFSVKQKHLGKTCVACVRVRQAAPIFSPHMNMLTIVCVDCNLWLYWSL